MPRRLGQQVGKQDEQRRDRQERRQEAQRLRPALGQPQPEQGVEIGAERPFADDAAQDGDGVEPDLHHGEILAGLVLHQQHTIGARVAFVRHLAQAQAARCGERNFCHREKRAGGNQQGNEQQTVGQGQIHGQAPRRALGAPWQPV